MSDAGTLDGGIDGVLGQRFFNGWVMGGAEIEVTITVNGQAIGRGRASYPRLDIVNDSACNTGFSIACDLATTDDDILLGKVQVEFRGRNGAVVARDLGDRLRAQSAQAIVDGGRPFGPQTAKLLWHYLGVSAVDGWLLNQFESLGRNCAFGHIQGLKKAAHLGLLRYSSVPNHALTVAMENRFAGVGDAAFTRVFVDPVGEFRTSDRRYDMSAHTKIHAGDVDAEDFAVRQMAKIRYLARNLLEDIEAGDKILVVHNLPDRIAPDLLDRLRIAVRSIGPAPIMYVEAAGGENPPGTVVKLGDGVFLAHVVSIPTEHYQATAESLASWLDICATTYRLAFQDG